MAMSPKILLFIALSFTSESIFSKAARQNCRCTYGSDCWPSSSDFQTLASQVSQPLVHPAPPATPCYNSAAENCSDVRAGWFNGVWRSDQPGAAEHTNWETYTLPNGTIEACYLNTTLGFPCQQGSVPVIGVDARTPEDIQAAVNFVAKHNLRLVIKNTGNDHLGRSSGRGSFLIWTHHLKNVTFHDSFCPTDTTDSVTYNNVFTFGSGVQWFEAYEAVKKHNRLIVGYVSPSGSAGAAGGWPQGGGLSTLTSNYGMGVDNVLEMTIVTADGNHVIANAYRNSDLFWALRGGGGGTWGVVTSVTYKTHPSPPFSSASISVNSTNANSTRNILTEIIRLTPLLVEQGYLGFGGGTVDSLQLIVLSPNVTTTQTQATFLPFFQFAHSQPGLSVQNGTQLLQDWWQFYDGMIASVDRDFGDGFPRELASWFLPKNVVETDQPEEIAAELLKTSGFAYVIGSQGGQAARIDPDSTAVNPIWRNSLAYVGLSATWRDGANSTEIDAARQVLIHDMKIVQAIAPESCSCLIEASRYEFNWKRSFFGTHYDNLRAIKQKYDPQSLFLVYEGVASDEWDADLNCRV